MQSRVLLLAALQALQPWYSLGREVGTAAQAAFRGCKPASPDSAYGAEKQRLGLMVGASYPNRSPLLVGWGLRSLELLGCSLHSLWG